MYGLLVQLARDAVAVDAVNKSVAVVYSALG